MMDDKFIEYRCDGCKVVFAIRYGDENICPCCGVSQNVKNHASNVYGLLDKGLSYHSSHPMSENYWR